MSSEFLSKKAEEIVASSRRNEEILSKGENSVSYHVIHGCLEEEEVKNFLGGCDALGFIQAYKWAYGEIFDTGDWRTLAMAMSSESQLKILQFRAQNFATDIGQDRAGPVALLFGACQTIVENRKHKIDADIDRLIMMVHQALNNKRADIKNKRDFGLDDENGFVPFLEDGRHDVGFPNVPSTSPNPSHSRSNRHVSDEDHEFLSKYTKLMNGSKFQPFFGRTEELAHLEQILAQSRRNNAILIGEAGVGKTAIVEGFVERVEKNNVLYLPGEKPQIYSFGVEDLVAGTMYRGELEKRVKNIIETAARNKGNVILFIDEIHALLSGISSNDIANQMKSALSSGEITVIGSTTFDEYRKYMEKNKALMRRFEVIQVGEPDRENTLRMLHNSVGGMEETFNVSYSVEAIDAAYDLGKRYLPRQTMPDAALSLLDGAGAAAYLVERGAHKVIEAKHIASIISRKTKVPVPQLLSNGGEKTLALESKIKEKVFSQDEAVEALVQSVQAAEAGLRPDSKMRGAFLFSGPTGVGKTEAAKVLATTMGVNFIRIDMSEYMSQYAVSKLIGSPPGYVGYDAGGTLTEAVHRNPYSVVLLDEVEKAHPDVFNIFLQTLDNGFMKDGQGRDIDFRNTYLIMTTNAGQKHKKATGGIGFTAEKDDTTTVSESINQFFSPEFRNRLDAVIEFGKLDQDAAQKVTEKMLREKANTLFGNKGIRLSFTKAAKAQVSTAGFDPDMGARPLARYIQKHIDALLSPKILRGDFKSGDVVLVDFKSASEGEKESFICQKFIPPAKDGNKSHIAALLNGPAAA